MDPTASVNRYRKRWLILLALAIVAAILLFPFQREVAPAWAFDVVDSAGRAMPGCAVEQHWEWVAAGVNRNETMTSDPGGRLHFPRRTTRASFATLWMGTLRNIGFHSPFPGPRAYFVGCAPGEHRDRLQVEKVGSQMVYTYVPGSEAVVKPLLPAATQDAR